MAPRCPGNALLTAGAIVTLIGLAVVAIRTWHIPREWTTVAVGVALLAVGTTWRLLRGRDGS